MYRLLLYLNGFIPTELKTISQTRIISVGIFRDGALGVHLHLDMNLGHRNKSICVTAIYSCQVKVDCIEATFLQCIRRTDIDSLIIQ